MFKLSLLLWLMLYSNVQYTQAHWGIHSIHDMLNRFSRDASCPHKAGGDGDMDGNSENESDFKDRCDENQILLQLARMYVISPERIILLLSMDLLEDTCKDVSEVLMRINATMGNCAPLPASNLYLKLYEGLSYFHTFICGNASSGKHISNYHDCLTELREDLIDCEGPPDWFEKNNQFIVCQYMNDIINCNYIKAAMLCGLTPALLLRSFSIEIMRRVVVTKCKVSRSLPHVEDPMPAIGNQLNSSLYCIFMLMFFHIIINKY